MTTFSPIQIIQIQAFGVDAPGTFATFEMDGVKAGDVLLSVDHITPDKPEVVGFNATSHFRSVVVEDNLMQQNGGDSYSDNEFTFTFLRFNQQD